MWNRLSSVALREERVAEQLVGWRQVRIHLQCTLQRRDGGAEIVLLHVRLAETDESVRIGRLKLGYLAKLRDGNIELSLFVGRDSRLHVLSGFRRYGLRREPQE